MFKGEKWEGCRTVSAGDGKIQFLDPIGEITNVPAYWPKDKQQARVERPTKPSRLKKKRTKI